MNCLLIPVEFNAATQSVLSYVSSFCKDVPVERIVLVKNYHEPAIAKILPDVNYVEGGNERYLENLEDIKKKLAEMATKLAKLVPAHTIIEKCLVDDKWLPAMQSIIREKQPDLILLGHDPNGEMNDSVIADKIIPFAKAASVSLLVVPIDAVYKKLTRVLIPTSFKNLDRLNLMQKLCQSNNWLQATMLVLNVDPTGRQAAADHEHNAILTEYLKGFHFQITYLTATDIVKEILSFARKSDVQLIMALPGKHSFLHTLTHQSITQTFALNAHNPVLLLK